jgi:hypothetical protein
MFMQLAQQMHGIEPLLDSFFGFMRRKTDFFAGPPGSDQGGQMAIQKVLEVVNKHAALATKDKQDKLAKEKKAKEDRAKRDAEKAKKLAAKAAAEKKAKGEEDVIEMSDEGFDVSATAPAAPAAAVKPAAPPAAPAAAAVADNKENAADAAEEKGEEDEEDDGTPPPVGNGGTVDGKYVWTQTLQEVHVTVPVPKGTKGRDLSITIGKNKLSVGMRGKSAIFEGALSKAIIVDDSFWTLEDEVVAIQMQKLNDMEWWNCVIQGDPTINTQKVQPENSKLADLDGETRQTVEKMMFDQRQKALNLPTADEQKKMDIMEKFKQQHPEMDFSKAKFT